MTANHKLKPSPQALLPAARQRPRPLPLGLALALAAGVTLVHLWLLWGADLLALQPQRQAGAPLSFGTRQVPPSPASSAPPATTPARRPVAAQAAAAADTPASPEAAADAAAAAATAPRPQTEPEAAAPPPEAPATLAATPAHEAAAAPQLPGSVRLRYELSGQARGLGYSAEGQLQWQQDGQRYEARMLISGFLLLNARSMSSVGELGPQGVAPRRFADRSRGEQATHFQPEKGRILFSSNAPEAAWQPGAQDRLSLFFQLAGLLAAEPARFTDGTQLRLLVAGTREADTWTFAVTGRPTLELPVGRQATVALRREPRREHDQTIEIWLAPALGYLPARIRITQGNGDVVDQKLAAVEPL